MSEEVKEEVKALEVAQGGDGSEGTETPEGAEGVKTSKDVLGFSPFIKETDRFDIKVRCYSDEKEGLFVDKVDPVFNEDREDIKEIKFVFKYPSQGDFNVISSQSGSFINDDDTPDHNSLNKLEFARFLVLVWEWSLSEELSNVNILNLDPKIVKAAVYGLREKLSLDGIF